MGIDGKLEKALESTYELIGRACPGARIDSLEVIKQVEEYRQLWKPEKTNVILLAESHVYTDKEDFQRKCDRSVLDRIIPNYPIRFVRFVYCLGYGEDTLLTKSNHGRPDRGTPQFWKIFSACISENPNNLNSHKILKTGTPSFSTRLRNKVEVLRQMKEKGIWLLDSSIVGLYGNEAKNDPRVYERVIETCWNNYVGKIIEESKPKFVIVIGKGVEKLVGAKLKFPYETIDLPQSHLSRQKQLENYRRYSEICTAILSGKAVSSSAPRTRPEEQDQFQDFKTLLDKLKGNGRISSEQWREYVGQWQKSPHDRDILIQRLRSMSATD
jgi:hypothetical protein